MTASRRATPLLAGTLASAAVLGGAQAAPAQVGFAPERTLVVDTRANPVSLHAAVNPGGDAAFVWMTSGPRSGFGEDVIRGRIRARGGKLLPVQTIRRSPRRLTGLPRVAYGGGGVAVAVWEEIVRPNGDSAYVMASVKRRGTPFGAPVRLGTTTRNFYDAGTGIGAEAGIPKVAVNDRGQAVVAWIASRSAIRAAAVSAAGRFGSAQLVRVAPGVPVGVELAAGIDRAGNASVAFVSGIVPPPADEDYPAGVRVATRPAGGRFGVPRHVSGGGRFPGQSSLSVGADGTVAVAWAVASDPEELPAGPVQAVVRRPGGDFSQPATISTGCAEADSGSGPRAAVTSLADVVAAWTQRACSPAHLDYAVSAPGAGFTPPTTLAEVAADAYVSELATDGKGRTVAAWAAGSPSPGRPVASVREPGQAFGAPVALGAEPPGGVVVTPKAAAGGRVSVVGWQTGRGFRYAAQQP